MCQIFPYVIYLYQTVLELHSSFFLRPFKVLFFNNYALDLDIVIVLEIKQIKTVTKKIYTDNIRISI